MRCVVHGCCTAPTQGSAGSGLKTTCVTAALGVYLYLQREQAMNLTVCAAEWLMRATSCNFLVVVKQ